MLTEAGENEVTEMVIALLVTVELDTQAMELVRIHVTTSPFCRLDVLKTELFVPTLIPLTLH